LNTVFGLQRKLLEIGVVCKIPLRIMPEDPCSFSGHAQVVEHVCIVSFLLESFVGACLLVGQTFLGVHLLLIALDDVERSVVVLFDLVPKQGGGAGGPAADSYPARIVQGAVRPL